MFQHVLADAALVEQMPQHRSLVETAVAKHGLEEWQNSCSKKAEYNIGLVGLLCNEPAWVKRQWVIHRVKGTSAGEVREQQVKAGEVPAMHSNEPRMEFFRKTDLIVRAVAEVLCVDPTPKALTKHCALDDGGYLYILRDVKGGCKVFKLGHFQADLKKKVKGKVDGARVAVWDRYSGRGDTPNLKPHAVGFWNEENWELYALVPGTFAHEQTIHDTLREKAKGGGGYLRSHMNPSASEFHDLRLLGLALQEMRKRGFVSVADKPDYSDLVWESGDEVEEPKEAEVRENESGGGKAISDGQKCNIKRELLVAGGAKNKDSGKDLTVAQIRTRLGQLRAYYEEW